MFLYTKPQSTLEWNIYDYNYVVKVQVVSMIGYCGGREGGGRFRKLIVVIFVTFHLINT